MSHEDKKDSLMGDFEEGVCVCCKAATEITWQPIPEMEPTPVCLECKEDGTFLEWLTKALESAVREGGWTPSVSAESGKTVWTPPPEDGRKA